MTKPFKACERCRSKKIKCDRNHPCAKCTKKRVDCVYKEKKKSGPKSLQDRVLVSKEESDALLEACFEHSNLTEALGISYLYINELKSRNQRLLLHGLHTVGAYIKLKDNFENLYSDFKKMIELFKPIVLKRRKEYEVLEFFQSLNLNCHILFMTAKPKESSDQIIEEWALIQVFNYHLIDFLAQPESTSLSLKRNVFWHLFEMSIYSSIGSGLQSFSLKYFVNFPSSNKRRSNLYFLTKLQNILDWQKQLYYAKNNEQYLETNKKNELIDSFIELQEEFKSFSIQGCDEQYLVILGQLPSFQAMIEFFDDTNSNKTTREKDLHLKCIDDLNLKWDIILKFMMESGPVIKFQGTPFLIFSSHLILKILVYNSERLNEKGNLLLSQILSNMNTLATSFKNTLAAKVLQDYDSKFSNTLFNSFIWCDEDNSEEYAPTSFFKDFIRNHFL